MTLLINLLYSSEHFAILKRLITSKSNVVVQGSAINNDRMVLEVVFKQGLIKKTSMLHWFE